MVKQEIIRDMKSHVGGGAFVTQGQMVKYLKRGHAEVHELLEGLDCLPAGKAKKYFIPDVAGRIMEQRQVG